jgi:hypothetical protein
VRDRESGERRVMTGGVGLSAGVRIGSVPLRQGSGWAVGSFWGWARWFPRGHFYIFFVLLFFFSDFWFIS